MTSYAMDIDNSSDSDEFDFGDKPPSEFQEPKRVSMYSPPPTVTSDYNYQTNNNNNDTSHFKSANRSRPGFSQRRGRGRRQGDRPRPDLATLEAFKNAVCRGELADVKHLLQEGIDPNTQLKSNWTALMFSADSGRPDVTQLLLDHSANPNSQCDMFTALMVCCASRQREETAFHVAELLLRYHANVNAQDRVKMTPFLYAAKLSHLSLLSLLVTHGAAVNKQELRGWSALCFAAQSGHIPVTETLLECGVDVSLETKEGEVAADIADNAGHYDVSQLIRSYLDRKENSVMEPEPEPEPEATDTSLTQDTVSLSDKDTPLSTQVVNNYVRYGDTELFLLGAGLPDLIPVIQSHGVEFSQLISMGAEELERTGVKELGARTKILQAIKEVHSKEWSCSPLLTQGNRTITALELAGVLQNFSKHCTYIRAQLSFIHKQLESSRDTLQPDRECEETKLVCVGVETAVQSANQLTDTLRAVETSITEHTGFAVRRQDTSGGRFKGTFLRLSLVSMSSCLLGACVMFCLRKL